VGPRNPSSEPACSAFLDGRHHRWAYASLPFASSISTGKPAGARDTLLIDSRSACTRSATWRRRRKRPPTIFPGYARAFTDIGKNADGVPSLALIRCPARSTRRAAGRPIRRKLPRRSFDIVKRWAASRVSPSDERGLPASREAHEGHRNARHTRRACAAGGGKVGRGKRGRGKREAGGGERDAGSGKREAGAGERGVPRPSSGFPQFIVPVSGS